MAWKTTNLEMWEQANTDFVQISMINANFEILDNVIGAVPSGSNLMNEISILTAPNGTKYRVKVANDGTLSTEAIS